MVSQRKCEKIVNVPFASSAGITLAVHFAVDNIQARLAGEVLEVLFQSVSKAIQKGLKSTPSREDESWTEDQMDVTPRARVGGAAFR